MPPDDAASSELAALRLEVARLRAELAPPGRADHPAALPPDADQLFRQLAGNAGQAFWVCDPGPARCVRLSAAYCHLSGRGSEALRESLDAWLATIHPEDREPLRREVLGEGLRAFQVAYRAVRPGGEARWLHDRVWPLHDPETGAVRLVLGIAEDITDRRRMERALRAREHGQGFLLRLGDTLRPLAEPVQIQAEACRLLGIQLGVAQVGFGEVDEAQRHVTVRQDWNSGRIPSVVGTWHMDSFGPALAAEMRRGEMVAIPDVALDPRTSAPEVVAAYRRISTRAVLDVPMGKDGRMVAMLFIHHPEPRAWSSAERMLAEETAERLWAAVELARAQAAQRESEARAREIADNVSQLVWTADATGAINWYNRRWYDYTGTTPEEMLGWGWRSVHHPEHVGRVVERFRQAVEAGEPWEDTFPLRGRDGGYRWFLSRALPIRDEAGRIIRWFGTNTDVTALREAERALRESEARLVLAQEAGEMGVYERDLVRGHALWSSAMFRLWGLEPEGRSPWISDAEYFGIILQEDREAHRARRASFVENPEAQRFSFEFRIRRPDTGEVRWIASRGEYERDAAGRAVLARGTNHDITERKAAEERQRLLAREVDHRAKNALAVVQSVVQLTPAEDPVAFKRAVQGRIAALARAQTLLAEDRWRGADLHALLRGELAPFLSDGQRIALEGEGVRLLPGMAQPVAMALHELATNAVKHGALSAAGGSLAVSWWLEGGTPPILLLRWAESGGPPLSGEPSRRGFGSRVLETTLRQQLAGAVRMEWQPQGLVCLLTMPLQAPADLPEDQA